MFLNHGLIEYIEFLDEKEVFKDFNSIMHKTLQSMKPKVYKLFFFSLEGKRDLILI